jgi:amino acid transporter
MSEQQPPARLTVRSAMFLGVGSMIDAGIFALLGEAGSISGAAVWMAFLVGGVVAALLGYVCAKLGSRYPSAGGLFASLEAGFGRGALVGISAWLGYIAAIVIVTAMIAVSFAAAVVLDRLTRRGSHAAGHASLGPV